MGKWRLGRRHWACIINIWVQHDVEINPGPSDREEGEYGNIRQKPPTRRGRRTRDEEKIREKWRKRNEARKARKKEKGKKKIRNEEIFRIYTWNVQKMSMRRNNRRKLREVAQYCLEKDLNIVLLTEVTTEEKGIIWIGEGQNRTVVIHGRKSAILLNKEWATKWQEDGSKRWLGERVTTVSIGDFRFVSVYQPLWQYGPEEMDKCRHEIEEQILLNNVREWLVIV